ncbi:hypothetical protein Pla52o_40850 [Novipirellula galeiformis]|uniref:Uncharacterized protein n=1 Tax=Novipirellula galeiformis TaxID=2528004 RepID=A0A5C6C8N2_9BACT|nr:hypothetical protein Pla52o_40850 [Novipirellula galeiformis]
MKATQAAEFDVEVVFVDKPEMPRALSLTLDEEEAITTRGRDHGVRKKGRRLCVA